MGHLEEAPDGIIGYDFEDKETRSQLELIDDLQKLGVSKYLDLPQLVVVGDQSTGKSSVLQAVTEIPFPINDRMCTRFATEIVLRRTLPNSPTEIEISLIPDSDESQKRKKELLSWRPDGFSKTASLDKSGLESIFRQAEKAIFGSPSTEKGGLTGKGASRLSGSTLRITRYGPKETNFAIVDIPGLVRGSDTNSEHRTARHLVEKYLKNLRSIVVVVIDVVDLERQEIFQMLNNLPDEESRVIGVINKCDTKQKKSHDWVFDLIRNDPSSSLKYFKEGWYGLRNRQASELSISDSERDSREEEFFAGDDWRTLNKQRLGRHELKKTLIKMRNRHVKKSIPELLSEIQVKLDGCRAQIERLGKPRDTNQAQFLLVNKVATRYSRLADGALDGQYKDLSNDFLFARKLIRDGLDEFNAHMVNNGLKKHFSTAVEDAKAVANLTDDRWGASIMEIPTYKWINSTINRYRGKEDAGDVNPEVKNELWKQQTTSWNEIANEALSKIEQVVANVNAALLEEACPDEELRVRLQDWLQETSIRASEAARRELHRLVAEERNGQLFTLHPSKTEKQYWYRTARIQEIARQCEKDRPDVGLPHAAQPPLKVNHISAEVIINTIIYGNPDLACILNTHDSLAAHYAIALYRFVDNFALQVIERHLLGPLSPLRLFTSDYVSQRLYGEKNSTELEILASENPEKANERKGLEVERVSLEASKKRVISFKIN